MPTKQAPKYSNPKAVVKGGFRRVSKNELKALGYSARSVLYTKAGVTSPNKFLTRSDIKKVQEPLRNLELSGKYKFGKIGRERIRAARRKIFRHTYTLYSDYMRPITLQMAIDLTEKFFDFLEKKHNPTWRNQIGIIYKGVEDDFSIMPRLWRDRQKLVIDHLKKMLKKYKAKMQIIFVLGWIEQGN